ncbi:dihydrofolate reductase [Nakamurella silvestris]|nr:dihydrofolate reductase [Nakamurella silvestris]
MSEERINTDTPPRTVTPGRTVTFVVAVADNGVIGHEGDMPWHLPEDLKHFKALTLGHAMVMGRRTFESIGRPLPGRRSLVVTRQQDWSAPGVEVHHTIAEALAAAGETVMVVGGGELYRQLLPEADVLEVTHIKDTLIGDTYFPAIDPLIWVETAREGHEGFDFVTYRRRDTDGQR